MALVRRRAWASLASDAQYLDYQSTCNSRRHHLPALRGAQQVTAPVSSAAESKAAAAELDRALARALCDVGVDSSEDQAPLSWYMLLYDSEGLQIKLELHEIGDKLNPIAMRVVKARAGDGKIEKLILWLSEVARWWGAEGGVKLRLQYAEWLSGKYESARVVAQRVASIAERRHEASVSLVATLKEQA